MPGRCGRGTRRPSPSRRGVSRPSRVPGRCTPPPTTRGASGTLSNASASVETDDRSCRRRARNGSGDRCAPGGDEDVLGLQRRSSPSSSFTATVLGDGDPRRAEDRVDLVLLEQEPDAVGQFLRRPCPCARASRGDRATTSPTLMPWTAKRARPGGTARWNRSSALLGNAADVQARAARRRALLDARDLHAELRRADRAPRSRRGRRR